MFFEFLSRVKLFFDYFFLFTAWLEVIMCVCVNFTQGLVYMKRLVVTSKKN